MQASELFFELARAHIWQGALIAVLLAGALVWGRRMGARTRCMLAATALAGAAVLPVFVLAPGAEMVRSVLGRMGAAPPASLASPMADFPPETAGPPRPTAAARTAQEAGGAPSAPTVAARPEDEQGPAFPVRKFAPVLFALWVAGASIALIRLGLDARSLARLLAGARASALPAALARRFPGLRVAEHRDVAGPMAAGVVRPLVIVPEGAVDRLPADELAALLEHERAHVERRDMLVSLVQRLVLAVFWWSPAMHWLSARVDEEREAACDEIAAERTGGARAFAETLVREAERSRSSRAPALAAGAGARGSGLIRRVRRLMEMSKMNRDTNGYAGRVALSLLIAAGLAVASATPRASLAEAAEPDAPAGFAGVQRLVRTPPVFLPEPDRSVGHRADPDTVEIQLEQGSGGDDPAGGPQDDGGPGRLGVVLGQLGLAAARIGVEAADAALVEIEPEISLALLDLDRELAALEVEQEPEVRRQEAEADRDVAEMHRELAEAAREAAREAVAVAREAMAEARLQLREQARDHRGMDRAEADRMRAEIDEALSGIDFEAIGREIREAFEDPEVIEAFRNSDRLSPEEKAKMHAGIKDAMAELRAELDRMREELRRVERSDELEGGER